MKEVVVAKGAWNFIGDVKETAYGLTISSASCIRVWGTTAGLGEIAVKGPTSKTILDFIGEVRIPTSAVIARFVCLTKK